MYILIIHECISFYVVYFYLPTAVDLSLEEWKFLEWDVKEHTHKSTVR